MSLLCRNIVIAAQAWPSRKEAWIAWSRSELHDLFFTNAYIIAFEITSLIKNTSSYRIHHVDYSYTSTWHYSLPRFFFTQPPSTGTITRTRWRWKATCPRGRSARSRAARTPARPRSAGAGARKARWTRPSNILYILHTAQQTKYNHRLGVFFAQTQLGREL